MDNLEYKGYTGSIEYSKSDDCLHGRVLGLGRQLSITYEGESLAELKEDFKDAVDDYLESCAAKGEVPKKPYSGQFVVRMPSELHQRLAEYAQSHGGSINDAMIKAAKELVS